MRYAQIRDIDIVNGKGIACSLFVQGCSRHCYNCFNSETWDFNGGSIWTKEIEDKFINLCKLHYIDCVSILGGEPFEQGEDLYLLLKRIKVEVNKPIYLWTGYTYENLTNNKIIKEKLIDYLIDGEYIDSLKDYKLLLRGSSNQRIIDIKKSKSNKIKTIDK